MPNGDSPTRCGFQLLIVCSVLFPLDSRWLHSSDGFAQGAGSGADSERLRGPDETNHDVIHGRFAIQTPRELATRH